MIGETIRHFRKAKGISQEELAVKLHVVRQTVSKWENGLSVPDADVLMQMAELLEVSVSQLLDIEADNAAMNVSEELARLNEQLAKKNRKEKLLLQVNRKRGLIYSFSFLAMLAVLLVQNEIVSLLSAGACVFAAIVTLYRNLTLLTITTEDPRLGVLRVATWFNLGIFAIAVVFALLLAFDVISFSEVGEKAFAMALISCVILFGGIVSPKLPYSKHTGLRLPWTAQDEDTWNTAHKILGIISFPVALLYIACALTISNFEIVTLCTLAIWIAIPGGLSYLFYRKKLRGKS